jgi:PAS domain S-box-containing protein
MMFIFCQREPYRGGILAARNRFARFSTKSTLQALFSRQKHAVGAQAAKFTILRLGDRGMNLEELSKEELIEEVQALQRQLAEVKRVTQERTDTFNEAEERYRSLFEAAFEGLSIHDGGEIVDANPTFCKMFGYELDELIGGSIWKLIHPDYHDIVQSSIDTRNEAPYEFVGLRKDGSLLAMEVIAKHHLY